MNLGSSQSSLGLPPHSFVCADSRHNSTATEIKKHNLGKIVNVLLSVLHLNAVILLQPLLHCRVPMVTTDPINVPIDFLMTRTPIDVQ